MGVIAMIYELLLFCYSNAGKGVLVLYHVLTCDGWVFVILILGLQNQRIHNLGKPQLI
jgi:hypothetical protein